MAGKSRHGKGKNPHHKKSKIRQRQAASVQPAQAVAGEAGTPVPAGAKFAPSPKTPAAKAPAASPATTTVQYPYIVSELKKIGIITGIILIVLIVATLILK